MRHRKAGVKLNRTSSHRDAMFRNMVTSLFKHERIRTTDVKAKELRRWADNLITLAKRGDVHARRQALSIIREKDVVHKLFAEAAERYGAVSGGYTRIVKLGRRPGDAAPISLIELLSSEDDRRKKKTKKKKKAKAVVEKKQVAEKKEVKEKAAAEEKISVEEEVREEKEDISLKEDTSEDKAVVLEPEVSAEDAAGKPEEKAAEPMVPEVIEKSEPEKTEDKKDDIGSKE
ncbi:MAG: 50S ribosomal protein L17 [Deltaproteobacteria bacterium]|nr:50S ribosomal protein L17 [Deltaproteobacteria bacterium]MBW2571299.1 50S ribosomal protein L17 [Deltaproteobacteria bacterium]MBW2668583.1 50S ribosomal protein L17 [Deltaproteobacteria bacterium]MBW2711043.1 50S ribosomal protein L17 [Deltaproteobacteria bacterium]